MGNNKQRPPFSWTLIAIYIIVSFAIVASGLTYINKLKDSITASKKNELKSVNDLKISQTVRWWHERLGDGIIIRSSNLVADCIYDFLNNEKNYYETSVLDSLLKSYIKIFDYSSAMILDNSGRIRLSIPLSEGSYDGPYEPLVPEVFRTSKVLLSDMYTEPSSGKVLMDLVIPFEYLEKEVPMKIGKIVLRVDPQKVLFPIIKSWPGESSSSETLLIGSEGDSVIFINKLRHTENIPLKLKKPVSDTNLLGSKAVKGFSGIAEGVDYRGISVIGAVRHIPGTGWYLISKVDKSELDHEVNAQVLPMYLLVIIVISGLGAVFGWSVWHQRVRYYRMRYEAEAEKLLIRKHFDYILKYANDIILLLDRDLRIVEVNDRVLDTYQYTREELIGMNIRQLRLPEYDAQLEEKVKILINEGTATYETVHRKKNGQTFPVEISARRFEIDGVEYFQSIGRDISERRKTEENLKLMIERYNLATQSANLAVWDWDVKNDILVWDDRVYELFGVKKGVITPVYKSWLGIVHPEDAEKADRDIKNAFSGKTVYNTEFRIRKPDGSVRHIKAYGQVLRDSGGAPERMIGINYDITDQRMAENMLREREFWLTESQRVGKVGTYVLDIPTLTWTSSEVLDDIFGIDETFSRTLQGWNTLIHPDFRQEMLDYVEFHVIKGKNIFDKEYCIINRNTGSELWLYGRGELRFDEKGNPVKLIGTIQDITEKKAAQHSLQVTEQTYTDIYETVSDAIYIHKPDGVFMDVNTGAVKMYGYSREELIGMTPALVGAPGRNDMEELARILNRVFETGKSQQFEFWGRRKNGEIFPKEVVSNKGKYFGQDVIISTARDITLRKKYEDELKRSKEKAEESDRLKTAFLHNISHEIRTPMNAIVGFTALLDQPDVDAESRKHFTDIITQSTNQLLGIISDIVDISNIETGQVRLTLNEVNINTVIRNLYDQFSLKAGQQNLLFHYEVKLPDERAVLYSDRTKLIQILSNLLGNAFKFTRQGTVRFGYNVLDSEIEFFVKDTGIGVAGDKFEKIFERFYQVEIDSSRRYSGAGLGLSISKAYVEMLGGKIWLNSTDGKGSEFFFTHPF
jgi:PAS domain S-box-containing protein